MVLVDLIGYADDPNLMQPIESKSRPWLLAFDDPKSSDCFPNNGSATNNPTLIIAAEHKNEEKLVSKNVIESFKYKINDNNDQMFNSSVIELPNSESMISLEKFETGFLPENNEYCLNLELTSYYDLDQFDVSTKFLSDVDEELSNIQPSIDADSLSWKPSNFDETEESLYGCQNGMEVEDKIGSLISINKTEKLEIQQEPLIPIHLTDEKISFHTDFHATKLDHYRNDKNYIDEFPRFDSELGIEVVGMQRSCKQFQRIPSTIPRKRGNLTTELNSKSALRLVGNSRNITTKNFINILPPSPQKKIDRDHLKRVRNNEASRKSRAAKKARLAEMEIELKELEHENDQMKHIFCMLSKTLVESRDFVVDNIKKKRVQVFQEKYDSTEIEHY